MLNATVVSRRTLAGELFTLHIAPDAGVPDFEPGQFVRIGLPEQAARGPVHILKRAYSIVSAPHEKTALELYLVRVEGGRLSPRLWALREGDRLWADPRIQGELTLAGVPASQSLLMLATGTGIAPYVSMLRAYAGKRRWRRFVVVHGARRQCDLGYREELERFAEGPDVLYVPVLSREPAELWPGLRGHLQQVLEPEAYERLTGEPLAADTTHVYACGNPAMVQDVRARLVTRGFSVALKGRPGNLHIERYW